jgi:RNA recognition motif-containing protein
MRWEPRKRPWVDDPADWAERNDSFGEYAFFLRGVQRMDKTIYVGNLPFSSSAEEVSELFSQYGTVHSVNLINDRETGRPRGFGFVEMDAADAQEAIDALNGSTLGGRTLRVNEARPKGNRPQRRQNW